MNYLIGDIGNTNIKICKVNHSFKIKNTFLFKTKSIFLEKDLKKKLNKFFKKNICDKVLISSVVPNVYKKVFRILKNKKFKVFELKDFNLNNVLKINMKNYSQLGSDRIANAIGAYSRYKTNCIVIDFGTATTFDIVKKPGVYDGGVIAPGISLSMENLSSYTALLPKINLKRYPKIYGKNTKEALNSGFFWGYEGLINNIVKKIIKKNKKNFKIILTGGYSKLFSNKIENKTKIEKDITIKGIIKAYRRFLA